MLHAPDRGQVGLVRGRGSVMRGRGALMRGRGGEARGRGGHTTTPSTTIYTEAFKSIVSGIVSVG